MSEKNNWIYGLMVSALIFSCSNPQRQKQINDRKLLEKLQKKEGYLNGKELRRLENNFSLKVLDKYDFSGFDEEDTLAYYVRSGEYLWMASCYLGDEDNPFFCLKEEKEKQFKLIRKGIIPVLYGDCYYELEKLLIPVGEFILVSQRSSGNAYCDDHPLIFHADGEPVKIEGNQPELIVKNCPFENAQICFERQFDYEFRNPFLVIHTHEKRFNWETEEVIGTSDFDLRFLLQDNEIQFQDTIFR